jgi:ribosomal protein L11 methylase PrmA
MSLTRVPGSYRDPSGFLFFHEGTLYRYVAPSYAPHYDALMQSGLYAELIGAGLLIPHQEVSPPASAPGDAYRVLAPETLAFVSYPYEWCFGQLKDAALCTLEIQRRALARGVILKDASAYNVQFRRGRPLWIDTLSFEQYRPGTPWIAYRQFCEHFLAPLLLMARVHVDAGRLLREYLDGVPLEVAARVLGTRAALSATALIHVVLHARSIRRFAGSRMPPPTARARVGQKGLEALIESLARAVRGLEWRPSGTEWADYHRTHDYAPESLAAKRRIVGDLLVQASPRTVWDLGANTGEFSRIAVRGGATTIALDSDPAAVELNYQQVVRDQETAILPLVQNLANPSPSIGWGLTERLSLVERGPPDVVLALALVHHLAISHNLPFDLIAGFLARLGRSLIVEYVPKDDPQLELLLRSRDDVFTGYTLEAFEQAFGRFFRIVDRAPLPASGRIIYSLRRAQP